MVYQNFSEEELKYELLQENTFAFKQIQKTKQEEQDTIQKELDIGLVEKVSETGINPFKKEDEGFSIKKALPLIIIGFLIVIAVFIIKD